jgi:hypothetical protein
MNIDDIAGRIPSLSTGLIKILASMSEGMSNGQIAEKLGYKNASIVSTYISLINKHLCLTSVDSRIEKRQIAIDAFKRSRRSAAVTIQIFPSQQIIALIAPILQNSESLDQIRSLLTSGYEITGIEMVFRRSRHQDDA